MTRCTAMRSDCPNYSRGSEIIKYRLAGSGSMLRHVEQHRGSLGTLVLTYCCRSGSRSYVRKTSVSVRLASVFKNAQRLQYRTGSALLLAWLGQSSASTARRPISLLEQSLLTRRRDSSIHTIASVPRCRERPADLVVHLAMMLRYEQVAPGCIRYG